MENPVKDLFSQIAQRELSYQLADIHNIEALFEKSPVVSMQVSIHRDMLATQVLQQRFGILKEKLVTLSSKANDKEVAQEVAELLKWIDDNQ